MPDPDIIAFAEMVGATEPSPSDALHKSFRRVFKRHNYFFLKSCFLIVKISRIPKPFWGLGKEFIDFANQLDNYFVVLLVSPREGWVFSKSEVNANIRSERWKLREAHNNYKIGPSLPDRNIFTGKTRFYEKLGINEP
jgi:hypothetical protein